jgi:hypothetical protein
MKFDVSLAGWILAVITFFAGTIIPVIYQKFSFEGVSIRQPVELRIFVQDEEQKKKDEIIFSTILKFANATNSSVLIDEIILNPSIINNISFTLQEVKFKDFSPGKTYSFSVPLSDEKGVALNYLPFIIKSAEERAAVVEFQIAYPAENRDSAFKVLTEYAENNGLMVDIRLNGKYRSYRLNVKR